MKKAKAPTALRSGSPELRGDSSTSDLQLKAQSTTEIDEGEAYVQISMYNIYIYVCACICMCMYV
jgi:hypothetical protein